ncbi:MAG TPA: sulfotransferase domain-containing protein [Urbifossiella sp.]|nr:sulfotransferase domain-containing protein [Urbifossiella sp.]
MEHLHSLDPHTRRHAPLPLFLVISPAKTGSTWLADNLRCHPQLFVPRIKEVKYFSMLYQWLDLHWYGGHFPATVEQMAGEASPSYAALPLERIRAIRGLMPDVKLIYLMREPAARAWSHAKHMHRYRESIFENCTTSREAMSEAEWKAAFAAEWPRASGDYLGHLRRWSSVFPAEQMYIGFYESIAEQPEALLRDIFRFLGADAGVDLAGFPLKERILAGPEGELTPGLEAALKELLGARTIELVDYLRKQHGLTPPTAWDGMTSGGTGIPACAGGKGTGKNARGIEAETDIERITAMEATFRTAYRQVQLNYRGHDIVFYRGRLLAIPHTLAVEHPKTIDGLILEQYIADGAIPVGATLSQLKEWVTNRVLDQTEHCRGAAEHEMRLELKAARELVSRLQDELTALTEEVRHPPPPLWKRTLRKVRRITYRPYRAATSAVPPLPPP